MSKHSGFANEQGREYVLAAIAWKHVCDLLIQQTLYIYKLNPPKQRSFTKIYVESVL